jgi:hypothetical protein
MLKRFNKVALALAAGAIILSLYILASSLELHIKLLLWAVCFVLYLTIMVFEQYRLGQEEVETWMVGNP